MPDAVLKREEFSIPPKMEAVLDSVAYGVFSVDQERRITWFNRMAENITGMRRDDALGRPCREVLNCSLCDGYCPLIRAMESDQEQSAQEAVLIRNQGRSVTPVEISAAPLDGVNGHGKAGVGCIRLLGFAAQGSDRDEKHRTWSDFIGESPPIRRMFETLRVVAPTNTTVLIEGPTGTGKDLIARIIHNQSTRRDKPFIKVNCAALPETLLESEMMGHKRGAFTGANADKPGRFCLADGGTIFLDEISEMALPLQAKLLRVIEDQEFYPLGARETTKVDVRILAACNKPLVEQVEQGLFREDLYYRLQVINVFIPPLKERRQDIPILIRKLIQQKNVAKGTFICRLNPVALDTLLNYDYPGNVRELQNILEHACLLCRGDVIEVCHLPHGLQEQLSQCSTQESQDEYKDMILQTLLHNEWNRGKTAKALGIDRTTLWRKMKRLGLEPPKN